jgi:preprotein translocase subunit YajC
MVGNVLAASTTKTSGFNPSFLFLILIVIAGFYLLIIRPQRRRQQQTQQQQNQVVPGVRVRTTAGMYATVIDVDGDDVVLEVAPGVEVRYMRRAIMDVVSPGDETAGETEEPVTDFAEDTDEAGDDWDKVDTDEVAESGTKSGTSKKN